MSRGIRCNHCLRVVRADDRICEACGLDPSSPSSNSISSKDAEASEMDNLVDDLINDFEGNPINKVSNPSTSLHSKPKRELSDSELLRKIAKHSEESARHLFFIRIGIAVIVVALLGGFTFTFR